MIVMALILVLRMVVFGEDGDGTIVRVSIISIKGIMMIITMVIAATMITTVTMNQRNQQQPLRNKRPIQIGRITSTLPPPLTPFSRCAHKEPSANAAL